MLKQQISSWSERDNGSAAFKGAKKKIHKRFDQPRNIHYMSVASKLNQAQETRNNEIWSE